jgi:hypothetical protein
MSIESNKLAGCQAYLKNTDLWCWGFFASDQRYKNTSSEFEHLRTNDCPKQFFSFLSLGLVQHASKKKREEDRSRSILDFWEVGRAGRQKDVHTHWLAREPKGERE